MAAARFLHRSFAGMRNYGVYSRYVPCRIPVMLRSASTAAADSLDISTDASTGIAILRMHSKPVNSLSLRSLTNLNIALDKLEQDDQINGLIITSVIPKIFSAGLDLKEVYQPKKEVLREHLRALQDFWLKLYSTRLITVAAINGHAIAGGCLIALCCDHRVMASGPYKIGLNEVIVGIPVPPWLLDTMENVVGKRISDRASTLGELFLPEEALKIGLVDEIVNGTDVLEAARREMSKWLRVPGHARQLTKVMSRKTTIDE